MGCPSCKGSAWFIKALRTHFACVLVLSCRNPNSCNLNLRCQSARCTIGFCSICIFLGGFLHAGGVDNHWRRLAVEGVEFPPQKEASKNRFSQQLEGWQSCRKSCLGAVGWSFTPGLFRVECFSCCTEVTQSSVVRTVKRPDAADTV